MIWQLANGRTLPMPVGNRPSWAASPSHPWRPRRYNAPSLFHPQHRSPNFPRKSALHPFPHCYIAGSILRFALIGLKIARLIAWIVA